METNSQPDSPSLPTDTFFANPKRDNWQEILRLHEKVMEAQETINAFDALPDHILILNQKRQIVFANSPLRELLGKPSLEDYLGKRPGEFLDCAHSDLMKSGCGCSEFCQLCGAAKAIIAATQGQKAEEECRITRHNQEAMDLRVWSRPFYFGDEPLILFTFEDISSEKRRRALERIFFHDVINTAGSIRSIAHIMSTQSNPEREARFKDIVRSLSDRLLDEIQAQRIISNAEHDELVVNPDYHDISRLMDLIFALYKNHELANGKHLQLNYQSSVREIETDSLLFSRVIGNMVKNALEASAKDEVVSIAISAEENDILFQVNNPFIIPRDIQLQIFNRSFSTKGSGRGLGTYSMKLLGEKYLKGQVSFQSNEQQGTTFVLKLPIIYPRN